MRVRVFFLLSVVLLLSGSVFAQAEESAEADKTRREREAKLVAQILDEAKNLRLPENRALVFARVANALWTADEKQARKLFSDAVAETVELQSDFQNERGSRQIYQAFIYGQTPRLEIIQMIGSRDAEFALELLAGSRPPEIAAALQNFAGDGSSTIQQYARAELTIEQQLLGQAAEQNPDFAVKRVREILKKGVSNETLNLLKKIYPKDPQTADRLAAELAESFLKIDFSRSPAEAESVGYFVAEMGRERAADEKAPRIPDELLRRLVGKMADDWLNGKSAQFSGYWNAASVLTKLFPERAALVKKRLNNYTSRMQNQDVEQFEKLIASDAAPEELIARAEKFQGSYRSEIYRAAANKFVSSGNIAQAEKLLQTGVTDENGYYLTQFYANLANQLAADGKFPEAIVYASRIEDEYRRINALINLANTAYTRDARENQKIAEDILNQARALLPDAPERQEDLSAMTYLAWAYGQFAPDEAFRLIEAIVPTINELTEANFVMQKFRGYGGVRRNELQMPGGINLGASYLETALRLLKQKDFDRTRQLTGGVSRPETRIWLQLHLLEEISTSFKPRVNYRYSKSGPS